MDLHILRYFLVVAREGSFSKAAKALYISQPTLSRQIKDLQDELNTELFVRTPRYVFLTKEGMRLCSRAQQIVEMADKIQNEFVNSKNDLVGNIYIGCGESRNMKRLAATMISLQKEYPNICFHVYTATADDIAEHLERGMLDFGIMLPPFKLTQYESIPLPSIDISGFLMRYDHPLATKTEVTLADIEKEPLLIPSQGYTIAENMPLERLGMDKEKAHIVGQYNHANTAAILVQEGMGIALCLEGVVDTSRHSLLRFVPITPRRQRQYQFVWKKRHYLTPAAEHFLNIVIQNFSQ